MTTTKAYEVQPNESQKLSLNVNAHLRNALTFAAKNSIDVVLSIKDNSGMILAEVTGEGIKAWAQIGGRGKVHASYSSVWGK
jgi:hypothetical protein